MSNLLEETLEVLDEHGKTMNDIVWIGTDEVEIPVDVFKRLADKEYDDGYGSQKVATDLVICGSGWYMERREYDGSEWWEFKEPPHRPTRKVIPRVIVDDQFKWEVLKRMNHPEGVCSTTPFDWEGMEA